MTVLGTAPDLLQNVGVLAAQAKGCGPRCLRCHGLSAGGSANGTEPGKLVGAVATLRGVPAALCSLSGAVLGRQLLISCTE